MTITSLGVRPKYDIAQKLSTKNTFHGIISFRFISFDTHPLTSNNNNNNNNNNNKNNGAVSASLSKSAPASPPPPLIRSGSMEELFLLAWHTTIRPSAGSTTARCLLVHCRGSCCPRSNSRCRSTTTTRRRRRNYIVTDDDIAAASARRSNNNISKTTTTTTTTTFIFSSIICSGQHANQNNRQQS
jgi:hypothetical protein